MLTLCAKGRAVKSKYCILLANPLLNSVIHIILLLFFVFKIYKSSILSTSTKLFIGYWSPLQHSNSCCNKHTISAVVVVGVGVGASFDYLVPSPASLTKIKIPPTLALSQLFACIKKSRFKPMHLGFKRAKRQNQKRFSISKKCLCPENGIFRWVHSKQISQF